MRFPFLLLVIAASLNAEKITVIGVGRLGLCIALLLEKAGYEVMGVDVSPNYIVQLNDKSLRSFEPGVSDHLRQSSRFSATTSLDEGLHFSDLYLVVVPTNPSSHRDVYNCNILDDLLDAINRRKVQKKHVVIVSTLFPGYICNVARTKLRDCPGTVISYNPEFVAQGSIMYDIEHPNLVLIGETSPEYGDALEAIYRKITVNDPYFAKMSVESSEIMKMGLNCFVTMKIAYANLIGDIADATEGADKDAILEAIGKDSRIGRKCLEAGYGFGGPCFPRDNRALGDYAQLLGIEPVLFRATDEANKNHAAHMAKQLLEQGHDMYTFEDVCYKSACPVPIIEESQKLIVAKMIADAGKAVIIQDRLEVIEMVRSEFGNVFQYSIVEK